MENDQPEILDQIKERARVWVSTRFPLRAALTLFFRSFTEFLDDEVRDYSASRLPRARKTPG